MVASHSTVLRTLTMIIIPYRRGNLPLRHLLRCPRRTLVVPSAGLRASNGTTRIPARSSIAAKGSLPWSYRLLRPSYSTLPSSDGRSAQPADDPNFQSILDRPPELVRPPRRRHGPGLVLLGRYTKEATYLEGSGEVGKTAGDATNAMLSATVHIPSRRCSLELA